VADKNGGQALTSNSRTLVTMGPRQKSAPDSTGKQRSILGFFSKAAPRVATSTSSALSAPRHALDPDPTEKAKVGAALTVPARASSHTPTVAIRFLQLFPALVQSTNGSRLQKHGPGCLQPLRNNNYDDKDDDYDSDNRNECEIESKEADSHDSRTPSRGVSQVLRGMQEVVVYDDGDVHLKEGKRKRQLEDQSPRKRSRAPSPLEGPSDEGNMGEFMGRWGYDPDDTRPAQTARPRPTPPQLAPRRPPPHKANTERTHDIKQPRGKSAWLANVMDMDKRPPDHPEYDKSTLFIPPHVWNNFTPFEKQYWAVKQKYWDTVVFFRKGKFYELLENDALLGHQLFDLRITERINMPMVGFPVSSFDTWANQFLSQGFKVARVDEMESALGMAMRVRDSTAASKKQQKIIRRELGCVLTGGTLVEEAMLHDDMATFCVAIKESTIDGQPAFGIAFVDTATAQFYVSQFQDDADLTKFETFVVQTSPRELVLEKSKSGLSTKALRILRKNATPTTIWNYLKPGPTGFWDAGTTRWELDSGGYFTSDQGTAWPETLSAVRNSDLLLSTFGALVHYLRTLKLERSLLSRGSFQPYSPIRQNGGTLVLDGQTLINLEIFGNSVDGGSEGTLFRLMNRCITPFGKRLFRQWVCHPLRDAKCINERLDAVDLLLSACCDIREQFSTGMAKLPDLERLVSRIHAGSCKPHDFVRVLEGFEQIEHTMMNLLRGASSGDADNNNNNNNGIIGRLVASMPNLAEPLDYWKGAFDREKASQEGLFCPSRGADDDFDNGVDAINRIKSELQALLTRQMRELKNRSIRFADISKEVYQLEVPKAVKVPKNWRQISATANVTRYYFKELDCLIRELQEAEETQSQTVRGLISSFYQRFDADSDAWLQSIHIVAQLDCLVSLANLSSSLAEPRCRPVFVEEERSVVEFEELRYPCVSVDEFIPNDIKLGGDEAKINLLTGANAAGKSTILRMVCGSVLPCLSLPADSMLHLRYAEVLY